MAKAATKTKAETKADKPKRAPNAAFAAPKKPSANLAAVIGSDAALPTTEAVSKIWDYIKKNNLQNPANKREILSDEKLKKLSGVEKFTMFEVGSILNKNLTAA